MGFIVAPRRSALSGSSNTPMNLSSWSSYQRVNSISECSSRFIGLARVRVCSASSKDVPFNRTDGFHFNLCLSRVVLGSVSPRGHTQRGTMNALWLPFCLFQEGKERTRRGRKKEEEEEKKDFFTPSLSLLKVKRASGSASQATFQRGGGPVSNSGTRCVIIILTLSLPFWNNNVEPTHPVGLGWVGRLFG